MWKHVNRVLSWLILLFMLAPIIIIFLNSFNSSRFFSFPPEGFTLEWYRRFLENNEYRKAIGISTELAFSAVILALSVGIPSAYALFKWDSSKRSILQAVFLSPLMLPGIVWAIGLIQYYSMMGLLGSFIGLVCAHAIIIIPYVIRLVTASLCYLDEDTEHAARTLGATPVKTFFSVTLPAIKPGIIISGIFGFMISFTDVVIATFIAGSKYITYPVRMYVELRTEGLDPLAVAVSAAIMFVIIIIALLAEKSLSWSKYL